MLDYRYLRPPEQSPENGRMYIMYTGELSWRFPAPLLADMLRMRVVHRFPQPLKDVLSTAFGLLCIGAYAGYARYGGIGRYLLVMLLLALGLAAKPMLVSWPIGLLLLDVWPLQRLRLPWVPAASGAAKAPACFPQPPRWLLLEKLPLLLLAILSAALTVGAQGRALEVAAGVPLWQRMANALVSVPRYLGKTFWPLDLPSSTPIPTCRAGSRGAVR